ncbi:MAG: response regulator [Solirubrobacteraceae bacterium]
MSLATSTSGPASARLRHRQPRLTEAPQRTSSSIQVVVGSHDPLSRAGITHVLREARIDVVASARNASDLVRKVRAYHPDLAVMDLDMEPSHSDPDHTEAVRNLRSVDPPVALLILSQRADERYVLEVVGDRPGGFGFLVKGRTGDVEDFTASVKRVARGGTAIDPIVISRLAGCRPTDDPIEDMTARERQVLALMAEGRSNPFIASELVVTIPAVERHITSIYARLGLRSNGDDHRRVRAILRYLGR